MMDYSPATPTDLFRGGGSLDQRMESQMTGTAKERRNIFRGLVAVSTAIAMLVFALPAFANAPDPETTTVDQVAVNADGSRTVTVEGTWTWQTQSKCSTARNGVGYQIDWFDNQTNAIGTAKDPDGILYVGDAQDNIVHSVEPLDGSSAIGNAFFDGVPASYLSHNTTNTTPTAADAKNWLSQCDGVNSSGVTAGHWGPISHTYAATFTGPIELCPIMYDPHGGHDNSGQSSVKDITGGASSSTKTYNDDNSYETNQTGPGPGSCPKISVPTLTTRASSATAPSAIHDTATLTGSSGAGSITFNLYPSGSNCSGAPLFTSSVSTKGDGDYESKGFSPSSGGTYQWQASYSSSTVQHLLSTCNDPNEQSRVSLPNSPAIELIKLERIGSAAFKHGPVTGNVGDTVDYEMMVTNTGNTPLALVFTDGQCDSGTLSGASVVTGSYDTGSQTLAPGGEIRYTCSHVLTADDQPYTNTASVTGTPPPGEGPPVSANDSVRAFANTPGIRVLKLQRDGDSGSFTTGRLTITETQGDYVVHTIEYEIQVTNTGNDSLTLSLADPLCDSGTVQGPTQISGTLVGDVLSPGGKAQYTCSHRLLKSDPATFTNVATVTGTPPSGPPVHGTSSVTAKKRTVAAKKVCRTRSGRIVHYKGNHKPAACTRRPHHHRPSRPPRNPRGFTG
jgi:uncharacterized repeat protein (TIGR01451 family)